MVLVAKFSKKCRGLRRHLALQVGELLHGVIWSLCKRPSCTPEPLLYGPLLRLKTYIASNLPLRLSSCDFVLCLVAFRGVGLLAAAASARFRSCICQRPNTKELLVRMRRGRRDRLLDTVERIFLVMEYWIKTTVLIIKYCKTTVLIILSSLV